MSEVFIDVRDIDIKDYFTTDLVSVEQLVVCIQDLTGKIEELEEREQDIEKVREFYEKREKEILSRVKEWY